MIYEDSTFKEAKIQTPENQRRPLEHDELPDFMQSESVTELINALTKHQEVPIETAENNGEKKTVGGMALAREIWDAMCEIIRHPEKGIPKKSDTNGRDGLDELLQNIPQDEIRALAKQLLLKRKYL